MRPLGGLYKTFINALHFFLKQHFNGKRFNINVINTKIWPQSVIKRKIDVNWDIAALTMPSYLVYAVWCIWLHAMAESSSHVSEKHIIILNSKFMLDKKSLKLSKFFLRSLIIRHKIEKDFEFSLQEKLSNFSGKMYRVSIFWMSVSKKLYQDHKN